MPTNRHTTDQMITKQMVITTIHYHRVTASGLEPDERTIDVYGRIRDMTDAVAHALASDRETQSVYVTRCDERRVMWGITLDNFVRYGSEIHVRPSRMASRAKSTTETATTTTK